MKKLICLLLAAVMVLALAACGQKDAKDDGKVELPVADGAVIGTGATAITVEVQGADGKSVTFTVNTDEETVGAALLKLGVIPVVNENDTVATDEVGVENTIGENDTLSAIVAAAVHADLLILLSDIDGLYDGDPHRDPTAKLIPVVPSIDAHILALGGGSGSGLGTGGMATKLKAAQIVTEVGCQMVIANGSKPALLYDIVGGKPVGTRFLAKEK